MPIWAYAVEKEMSWRGGTERFSNVYHYEEGPFDIARHEAILDLLVTREKDVFSNQVTFKSGAVWGPITGNPADALVVLRKDYSGQGLILNAWPLHRESSIVVACPLPRGGAPHFRKRFLRKFLHVGALATGDSGLSIGTSAVPVAERTRFNNWFDSMKELQVLASSNLLCAPNGHKPTGPAYTLTYPHIRQFKR